MTKINKGVIHRTISFVLFIALCLTLLPMAVSATTQNVRTRAELAAALNNLSITEIIVTSYFDWDHTPITIAEGRTLTINQGCYFTINPPHLSTTVTNHGTINILGSFKSTVASSYFNNHGVINIGEQGELLFIYNNSKLENHDIGIINNAGRLIIRNNNFKNEGLYTGAGVISKELYTDVPPIISGNNTQYIVTFDENYASVNTNTVSLYAAKMGVMMPAIPTRTDYTFMGWNTAADGSGTIFDSTTALSVLGTTSPVTESIYAQWASQACDITGFTVPNQVGTATIIGTNIGVTVPYGTDLTTLVPTIVVSDKATVSPASGTADNFTNPVTYTVTAADGTTKQYIVTVTIGAQATYAVTVTNGTSSGSYPQGATVNITADTPPGGQVFDKWTSSDVGFVDANMEATSFTMPAKAVDVTATYKAIPPAPLTKHTITLGASGDGTVTGGGTFDENSTVTVTATANAGNSFVNWTENGVEVSTNASYPFVVTSARKLVANFKADSTPDPTPSPNYSGGSSDNYVGSNKADTSPNLKPSVVGRPFTKADATNLFNAALADMQEGQTTLSKKAYNYTSVDKAVLAELAALAEKNGVTLTVHFDTVVGKAVTYRISVNPATVTTNLDLTVKIVGGKITMPKFSPAVEVAVLMPAGLTIENLKITENGKDITATAKLWLDKNGYIHFTTTGGEIVLGK